jgi:hypothetical protein
LAATTLLSVRTAAADPTELPGPLAYNYGEAETPRGVGMGGAVRALGTGINATLANPANLGVARVYHIQALAQFTPESGRQLYGGAIADSTRRFAGSVAFFGGFVDPDGIDRSFIDIRSAVAFAISDKIHVGAAGRYLTLDQEGFGPLGDSRASGGLRDPDDPPNGRSALVSEFTFSAGVTVLPTEGLHIGVVGHNLTYPGNGVLPTSVGGGIGYGNDDFSIEVDAVADFNSWSEISPRVMAGGEYLVADAVPIRLGYQFDLMSGSGLTPSHSISGGAGYIDTRFSIEASVRRTLAGPGATTIVAGVTVFMESFGVPIEQY